MAACPPSSQAIVLVHKSLSGLFAPDTQIRDVAFHVVIRDDEPA
jgi:hypothetical protein